MTDVRIVTGEGVKGSARVFINGVDFADHVAADGFRVEMPADDEHPALVYLTVIADRLDMDLRNCEVIAKAVASISDIKPETGSRSA